MADALDSIVKGAPMAQDLPHLNKLNNAISGTTPIANAPSTPTKGSSHHGGIASNDPLNHTPSSPSMIYLNLLILEASLRAQYLELRARRRHHTFFLALLGLWTAGFGYALFLAPREDGSGVGGSVYWVVETSEKVCFLGGIMTGVLVWATGIWERGVRWPRRWLTVSNRGLRGFNCKVVLMKRPWWKEALGTVGWFLTYGLFSNPTSSYRYVEPAILREVDRELGLSSGHGHPTLPVVNVSSSMGHDMEKGGHEEDLSPGGDYVKLLLLAKPFSPTFRENWELYRSEYWEKENERRALLRAKLKERDRKLRKQTGGWFWWLPWRRTAKTHIHHHHHHHHHGSSVTSEKALHPRAAAVSSEHRRTRSSSTRRGSMNGNSALRSTTPTPAPRGGEFDDGPGLTRKGSSSLTPEKARRKKTTLAPPGSATKTRPRVESRSVTPENPSPLAKESSLGPQVTNP